MNWIKGLLSKKKSEPRQEVHEHQWGFCFYTGNAMDGKSEVWKCACGQMAVRHYGQAEKILIKSTTPKAVQ